MEILRREFVYIWYYFSIQLEQVFFYWVVGMVIGSAVSVFGKGDLFRLPGLGKEKTGSFGTDPCQSAGNRLPTVHVWDDPDCRVLLPERHEGRYTGVFYDEFYSPESSAADHKRHSGAGGVSSEIFIQLTGWDRSRTMREIFLQGQKLF